MKSIVSVPTDIKNLRKTKSPPELQFHVAASLVAPGDPFSVKPEEQQDKVGEVCQFCVPVPAHFVGRLKKIHVDNAFEQLKNAVIIKLREHGVMSHGE